MKNPKMCGRITRHLAHHWQGGRRWDEYKDRWVKPVYWCKGYVITEGGNHVH